MNADHAAITKAVLDRDVERAVGLTDLHLDATAQWVARLVEASPEGAGIVAV